MLFDGGTSANSFRHNPPAARQTSRRVAAAGKFKPISPCLLDKLTVAPAGWRW